MKRIYLLVVILCSITAKSQISLSPSNMKEYVGKVSLKQFANKATRGVIYENGHASVYNYFDKIVMGDTDIYCEADRNNVLSFVEFSPNTKYADYVKDFLSIKGVNKKIHMREETFPDAKGKQQLNQIIIEYEGFGMKVSNIMSVRFRISYYNCLIDREAEQLVIIEEREREKREKQEAWKKQERQKFVQDSIRKAKAENANREIEAERKARAGFFEPENIIPMVGRGTKQQFETNFGVHPIDFRGDLVYYSGFEWPVGVKFSDNVVVFVSFRLFGNLGYEYLEKLRAANFTKQLTEKVTSFESGFGDFDVIDTKVDVYAVKDNISFIVCRVYYSRQFMGFELFRQPFTKR